MDEIGSGLISMRVGVTRRGFLRLVGLGGGAALLSACSSGQPAAAPATAAPAPKPTVASAPPSAPAPGSPAAAPASASAPAQQSAPAADWDKVIAAANQEGQVAITTLAGDGYRKMLDQFRATYPKISVEHKTVASASFLAPQVLQEQSGGIFSFDVAMLSPGGPVMGTMMPGGAFSDIRPVITLPDATADSGWIGGFEAGWMDKARQKVYGITFDKNITLYRNTDLVPDGVVKSVRDLLDPRWKGKFLFLDYTSGFTYNLAVVIKYHLKEEAPAVIKGIFVDQQPVFERDGRAVAEALIRGQYAFGTGPTSPIMGQFYAQGIGKNVQPFDLPELTTVAMWAVLHYQKPPHPNAAKLLVNWLLSKDGAIPMSLNLRYNSRRADVPVLDPAIFPGTDFQAARKNYLFATIEENVPLQQQAIEELKQLIVT